MKVFINASLFSYAESKMKRANAKIRLRLSSDKHLATLLDALAPEASAPVTKRARVVLCKEELGLVLAIEARDTAALRATLNAYLRWIYSTMNVIEAIETYPRFQKHYGVKH